MIWDALYIVKTINAYYIYNTCDHNNTCIHHKSTNRCCVFGQSTAEHNETLVECDIITNIQ